MWLVCSLICLVADVSQGNFRPISKQTRVKEIQAVSSLLKMETKNLQYNLKMLMGDHYPMLLSFPPLPDFSSLESIKTMLKPGDSVASLKDLHSQAVSIAAVVIWYFSLQDTEHNKETELAFYEAEMPLQEFLYQITKEFGDINKTLRDIEIFWFALWDTRSHPDFDRYNYATNRKSIRSLRNLWSCWTFSLRNSSDYDHLLVGCKTHDMNDWFSRFNETMTVWITNSGLRYPRLRRRDRRWYTTMARFIKSDMCEATILLGVCDEVLNLSENDKNRNLASVIAVYERFADMFTEADRELVTNASFDIARSTELYARAANGFRNGLSLAEIIRRKLKEQFYWLDFTVIVFEAGETSSLKEWAQTLTYTERSNEKQDFCVIPVRYGMIANEERTWKAIVYVSGLSPRKETYDPLWAEVEQAVSNCRSFQQECGASKFFEETTKRNNSIPLASYFLTAYNNKSNTKYEVSGPAGLPGRVAELKMFVYNLEAVMDHPTRPEFRRIFHVIAAAPCNPDIFAYIDN